MKRIFRFIVTMVSAGAVLGCAQKPVRVEAKAVDSAVVPGYDGRFIRPLKGPDSPHQLRLVKTTQLPGHCMGAARSIDGKVSIRLMEPSARSADDHTDFPYYLIKVTGQPVFRVESGMRANISKIKTEQYLAPGHVMGIGGDETPAVWNSVLLYPRLDGDALAIEETVGWSSELSAPLFIRWDGDRIRRDTYHIGKFPGSDGNAELETRFFGWKEDGTPDVRLTQ